MQRYSFITTLFLGPFDDVITEFYCNWMTNDLGPDGAIEDQQQITCLLRQAIERSTLLLAEEAPFQNTKVALERTKI
jgi:hypothetical protein